MGITQISDAKTWEIDVINSDVPVFVDFWAEWCGPCRMLGPRFEELSKEMTNVKFGKVNVDENQDTAGKFGIRSIPTMLVFKKGEVAGTIVGALPKDALKEKIESFL